MLIDNVPTPYNSYDAVVANYCECEEWYITIDPMQRQCWWKAHMVNIEFNLYWACTTHQETVTHYSDLNQFEYWE